MIVTAVLSRFRFGLRTLFVLVTVASVICAWAAYSLHWIRVRHEAIERKDVRPQYWGSFGCIVVIDKPPMPRAPGGLWLFGESGIDLVHARVDFTERAGRLFPESRVMVYEDPLPDELDDWLAEIP